MEAVLVGTSVAPAGFSAAPDQRCRVWLKPSSLGTRRVASEGELERRERSSEMCLDVRGERVGRVGVGSPMDPIVDVRCMLCVFLKEVLVCIGDA